MPVSYNYVQGVDLPSWHWLSQLPPGSTNPGTSNVFDGSRYIYWAIQYGSTATTASTTQLWRYDTWTNGWQYLVTLTSGNQGIDLEYDPVRNIIWIIYGASLTEWRYFNLNTTGVTAAGVTTGAFTLSAAVGTVLPAAASVGSSLAMANDVDLASVFDSGAAATGTTTTTIVSASAPGTFLASIVGLQIRFTSGLANNQRRIVTGVTSSTVLTVSRAFGMTPAAGDTWVLELPADTAASGTTTTLVTPGGLPTNAYANADVVITSGTGSGQRRRVASNDATTLTLSASTAGNARTGAFATAPDSTSVYQLVPSSDFLYYVSANGATTAWKIDVVATTPAWVSITAVPSAPAGGANFMHPAHSAPFRLILLRGNGSAAVHFYDPGTNAWSTPTVYAASETFTTGASSALLSARRKIFIQKESSQRCYILDLVTGQLDAAGLAPYAAPSGYEGHRARYVRTPSGVEWIYLLRAGGQEFFRVPVEWL